MHLSAAILGGLTLGNPRAFAPRHLQIPLTQDQYSSTKSYHCPSLREHNKKKISLEEIIISPGSTSRDGRW